MDVNIYPVSFEVFGVNVGLSVVVAWCVLAVVIGLLVLANLYIRRRFSERPKGLQNVLEMVVSGLEKWAKDYVGDCAPLIAPITLTLMIYVFSTSIIELFGLPPATSDFNCTLGLGISCFLAVNVTGVRYRGLWGRAKRLFRPNPAVTPIRLLTDLITPFSMGIRLFANILVGSVIMEMIYSIAPVVLPAAFSSFFTVAEIGIQVFVFGLLSLIYTSEAVE
jgi:F-type H+-transporting ATPase subunit a